MFLGNVNFILHENSINMFSIYFLSNRNRKKNKINFALGISNIRPPSYDYFF
jgi:hypothetical protein